MSNTSKSITKNKNTYSRIEFGEAIVNYIDHVEEQHYKVIKRIDTVDEQNAKIEILSSDTKTSVVLFVPSGGRETPLENIFKFLEDLPHAEFESFSYPNDVVTFLNMGHFFSNSSVGLCVVEYSVYDRRTRTNSTIIPKCIVFSTDQDEVDAIKTLIEVKQPT